MRKTYSSIVKVSRSFKSAPAQKTPSTLLAIIKARTLSLSAPLPSDGKSFRESISAFRSLRSFLDMAFRASGLSNLRILIVPQ